MASSARTSQRRARAGASPQAAAGGGRRANGGGGAQFGLEPRQVRAEGGFAQDQRWAGWLGGRVRGGKQRWGARSRTGRQTVRAFWPIDAFQSPPVWLHRIGTSGGARASGAARGQSDGRQSPRGKSGLLRPPSDRGTHSRGGAHRSSSAHLHRAAPIRSDRGGARAGGRGRNCQRNKGAASGFDFPRQIPRSRPSPPPSSK